MGRLRQGSISMAFIKGQARRQANEEWSSLIAQLSRERGYVTFRRRKEDIPKIPKSLQKVPKRLAARFFSTGIRTRNDRPLFEGEVWMGGLGHMLVVF